MTYDQIDLADEKVNKTIVHRLKTKLRYPWIIINDIFIGSTEEFEEIIDNELLMEIHNKSYLKMCIICKSL